MRLSNQEESKIITEIENEINECLPQPLEKHLPKPYFSYVLHPISEGYELLWEVKGRMEDNAWLEFNNNLQRTALNYNVIRKISKLNSFV